MGRVLVLMSAAGFGTGAIFGKLAYSAGVSADALLLFRFLIAAVMMGVILLVRPSLRSAGHVTGYRVGLDARTILTGLVLGGAGYAVAAMLFFAALPHIDASVGSLVLYTYPLMVTLGTAALGRGRLTPRRGGALLAATAGTVLVLLGAGGLHYNIVGVALAFGAALVYTAYMLAADLTARHIPPMVLATLVMTGASITLAGRVLLGGGLDLHFGALGWTWVLCMALVATVLAMLAFFAGLARTDTGTVAILSTFEPVVTTTLAALTLHEFLAPLQLLGAALVLSAIPVLQLKRRTRSDPDTSAGGPPETAPAGLAQA